MVRDDDLTTTYRMQRDELSPPLLESAPARRTSPMPEVTLAELLAQDRELQAAPAELGDDTERVRFALDSGACAAAHATHVLGTGPEPVAPHSPLRLAIAFVVALLLGIALTVPLWG